MENAEQKFLSPRKILNQVENQNFCVLIFEHIFTFSRVNKAFIMSIFDEVSPKSASILDEKCDCEGKFQAMQHFFGLCEGASC